MKLVTSGWTEVAGLVSALAGVFASGVLTYGHMVSQSLPCGVSSGCLETMYDSWASVGPIPTAALAAVYFVVSAALSGYEYLQGVKPGRASISLTALGSLASLAWALRAIFYLDAFCPWCFTCFVAAVAILLAKLLSSNSASVHGQIGRRGAVVAVAVLLTSGLLVATVYRQSLELQNQTTSTSLFQEVGLQGVTLPDTPVINKEKMENGTLVAFLDFHCPSCRRAYPILKDAMEKHELAFAVHLVAYPENDMSMLATAAAYLANSRGQFWKVCDWAFNNEITVSGLKNCMRSASISPHDQELVLRSFETPPYQKVTEIREMSVKVGMEVSPTFVLFKPGGAVRSVRASELPYLDQL